MQCCRMMQRLHFFLFISRYCTLWFVVKDGNDGLLKNANWQFCLNNRFLPCAVLREIPAAPLPEAAGWGLDADEMARLNELCNGSRGRVRGGAAAKKGGGLLREHVSKVAFGFVCGVAYFLGGEGSLVGRL
jgi:hypothetical protein